MRTRGITIYQETLIPRKKSNGTVLGDPIRTRRKGLAAWLVDDLTGIPLWAENSGCMFWKPHGSMFTRQGGSRYIGKPRLRLLWIGIIDPHSYCPSRPIRLLRFNGNQHIFFLVGALEHVLWLSIQLGMYGMSSSQLTNSIIFPDGYCTTNQIIINHH